MKILAKDLFEFNDICEKHHIVPSVATNVSSPDDLSAVDMDKTIYVTSNASQRHNYNEVVERAINLGYNFQAAKRDIRLKKAIEELMLNERRTQQHLINEAVKAGEDISKAAFETLVEFNAEEGGFEIKCRMIMVDFPNGVH